MGKFENLPDRDSAGRLGDRLAFMGAGLISGVSGQGLAGMHG